MNIEEAKSILTKHLIDEMTPETLYCCAAPYIYWSSDNKEAALDGEFDLEHIEAVATYIRHYSTNGP